MTIPGKQNLDGMTSDTTVNNSVDYERLIQLIPSPVAYIDKHLRYRLVNKAYEEWVAQSADFIIGKTISSVMGPDAYFGMQPYMDAVLSGEPVQFEHPVKTNDGWRYPDISFTPDIGSTGEVLGYIKSINDNTDRKRVKGEIPGGNVLEDTSAPADSGSNHLLETQAKEHAFVINTREEQLRQSEERYHRMISEVQDYAIILLSRAGIIENWNKGAERIKGYSPDEIIGKNFRIFYTQEDRDNRFPDQFIETARIEGKALHEGWRVRKDGSLFWGSVVLTALHDTEGNHVGFSKVTRDLTERKASEDLLKEKNKELEKLNEELSTFAYVSSHDLQEPLRKIQTFVNRLLDLEGENFSEKGLDYFNRIQNAAQRMRTLIDDLLIYSRASTQERELSEIDLNEVLYEVREELSEMIEEKQAVLTLNSLPVIPAMKLQWQQLLVNILHNALKFTRKDVQPHIKICSELLPLGVVKETPDAVPRSYHHICISDNGIGFSSEHKNRIFEIFQRLHGKNEFEGTGIGLAICKKIVEIHGGFIEAEGEEGKGAAFHIYLPVISGVSV